MPWRETEDPYRILISEVMSQQTQLERVVARYERFLTRFPTIEDLAAAPLREVLEEWSGLGYNSRARRLWESARSIASAGWPETAAGLQELPGIGPYTAAALGSFAFGRQEAAVDTNLRRVLSRWEGRVLEGADLRDIARRLVPEPAAAWNQAIMDLASSHCRSTAPRCDGCPVAPWCRDPTITPKVPRQGRFEGSRRQIRGTVLRLLAQADTLPEATILSKVGAEEAKVRDILAALVTEGLISRSEGSYRLGE